MQDRMAGCSFSSVTSLDLRPPLQFDWGGLMWTLARSSSATIKAFVRWAKAKTTSTKTKKSRDSDVSVCRPGKHHLEKKIAALVVSPRSLQKYFIPVQTFLEYKGRGNILAACYLTPWKQLISSSCPRWSFSQGIQIQTSSPGLGHKSPKREQIHHKTQIKYN